MTFLYTLYTIFIFSMITPLFATVTFEEEPKSDQIDRKKSIPPLSFPKPLSSETVDKSQEIMPKKTKHRKRFSLSLGKMTPSISKRPSPKGFTASLKRGPKISFSAVDFYSEDDDEWATSSSSGPSPEYSPNQSFEDIQTHQKESSSTPVTTRPALQKTEASRNLLSSSPATQPSLEESPSKESLSSAHATPRLFIRTNSPDLLSSATSTPRSLEDSIDSPRDLITLPPGKKGLFMLSSSKKLKCKMPNLSQYIGYCIYLNVFYESKDKTTKRLNLTPHFSPVLRKDSPDPDHFLSFEEFFSRGFPPFGGGTASDKTYFNMRVYENRHLIIFNMYQDTVTPFLKQTLDTKKGFEKKLSKAFSISKATLETPFLEGKIDALKKSWGPFRDDIRTIIEFLDEDYTTGDLSDEQTHNLLKLLLRLPESYISYGEQYEDFYNTLPK